MCLLKGTNFGEDTKMSKYFGDLVDYINSKTQHEFMSIANNAEKEMP